MLYHRPFTQLGGGSVPKRVPAAFSSNRNLYSERLNDSTYEEGEKRCERLQEEEEERSKSSVCALKTENTTYILEVELLCFSIFF